MTHIIQVGEIDMRKSNHLLLGKGRGEEKELITVFGNL